MVELWGVFKKKVTEFCSSTCQWTSFEDGTHHYERQSCAVDLLGVNES